MVTDSIVFADDLDCSYDLSEQILARATTADAIGVLIQACVYDELCEWFGEPA
jgi:hypothetical protein